MLHRGGYKVQKGTYWNLARGQRVDVAEEAILPGDRSALYIKMSTAGILVAGPMIGLLYAVFLPFIGIAMTLVLIGRKLLGALVHVAVKSTSFGWRPIEAYLDGKQRRKVKAKDPKNDDKK